MTHPTPPDERRLPNLPNDPDLANDSNLPNDPDQSDESVMVDGLRAIAAAVLETEADRITPDAAFHEQLEMDSLQKTEFVARVERAYGARFDAEEAAGMDCLADVLAALRLPGEVRAAGHGGAR